MNQDGALRFGGLWVESDAISAWLHDTHRILRAESTIHFDDWRACPVGVALQLVLTRPEPSVFKTWFRERPDLPPAVLGDSEQRLDVRGPVRMRVPTAAVCEEVLDVESFRRAVAVEAGMLPDPPVARGHGVRFQTVDVPGLLYVADFLSEGEEDRVVGVIDLLIAAYARSVDATLVTNNAGEFGRVPDLRVENWT